MAYLGRSDDYLLWKTWWLGALYGASAERRMAILDERRRKEAERTEHLNKFLPK